MKLAELFGTDEQSQGTRDKPGLFDQVFGTPKPDTQIAESSKKKPGAGRRWLEVLVGSPQDETENAQPDSGWKGLFGDAEPETADDKSKAKNGSPPGSNVVNAVGTFGALFIDAAVNFRRLRKPKTSPTPVDQPPTYQPFSVSENSGQQVMVYNEWKLAQLQAIDAIGQWPKSTFYHHPDIVGLRARVARFPRHRQLEEATRIMESQRTYQKLKEAVADQTRTIQATRKAYMDAPLSSADWNGYAHWQEHVQEVKRRQRDTSGGFAKFLGRKLWDSGTRAVRRQIDSALATKAPKILRGKDATSYTINDDHLDDQIIFDGARLILINPSGARDVQTFPVDQIDNSLEFAVEGGAFFQGIAPILTMATGSKDPMLVAGRGTLIVRAKGRNEEFVRVGIIRPQDFQRALLEAIAATKSQPPPPKESERVFPHTVRDLLQYAHDDEQWWKMQQARRASARNAKPTGQEEETKAAPPTDDDENEDRFEKLEREIENLKRQLRTRGLTSGGSNTTGDENITDGEWKIIS